MAAGGYANPEGNESSGVPAGSAPTVTSAPQVHRAEVEVRPSRRTSGPPGGRSKSPREEAIRAAEAAAEARLNEIRQRRESAAVTSPASGSEHAGETQEGDHQPGRPRVPENAADGLYNMRMRAILRAYFYHWHAVTLQRVVRRSLEQRAILHDRRILLRQAFDIWQEVRWFAVVERRAQRRYESNLLSSAFSVWLQRTAVIVQRTDEVRQRILARKYFAAWRKVVLENDAKVRLFQTWGALSKWRTETAKRRQAAAEAQRAYEGDLMHRAYWVWWFKLCNRLGIRRSNKKISGQKFFVWVNRMDENVRRNMVAEEFFRRRTLQVVFQHWSIRTLKCLGLGDDAADHQEWSLARRSLETWRRQTSLTPLLTVMVEYVNDRIADTSFTLWRTRANQSIAAARMARGRVLKSAFRNWRLQVRRVVMDDQVCTRIATSKLHEWVLQLRLRDYESFSDMELGRSALTHWVEKYRRQKKVLEELSHQAMVLRNRRTASHVLNIFRQKLHLIRLWEGEAEAVYRSGIQGRAFDKWRAANDTCVELEDWADDAIYYFTVRRTLRRWIVARKESRRRRLRAAFHIVSRNTKRTLAGAIMDHWKKKSNHIRSMNRHAETFRHEHVQTISFEILQLWRDRTDDLSELRARAEEENNVRLMKHHHRLWIDNHNHVQEQEGRAELLSEAAAVRAVVKYFAAWEARSFHLRMLQLKGERRFERRHLKSLLRVWRDRALESVDERQRERTRVRASAGIDDTIEEEFGDTWVPPINPATGRSSTPVGDPRLPYPNLMLTTPRRASAATTIGRSRLFGRTPAATPGSPLTRFSARRTALIDLGRSRLGR